MKHIENLLELVREYFIHTNAAQPIVLSKTGRDITTVETSTV